MTNDTVKSDQELQIKRWHIGVNNRNIFELKGEFGRTKMKEITSAELYKLFERALSGEEYLFQWNKKLFKKWDPSHNREIYNLFQSYIVVDKNKIPPNFLKLFNLEDSTSVETDVKRIFNKARLIDPKSARIIFVDDKIVIFRNEEKLVHKESKGLTSWEKRRSKISTTFNTFSNIYDAIRSQYHTISWEEEQQDEYKITQKEIIRLIQEINVGYKDKVKDGEFWRKLDWIIQDIENATNYRVLWAKLYNLDNLTFKNSSIDSKLLEWAKNKIKKRFDDLQNILGVVKTQLNTLESILTENETPLEMFLAQNSMSEVIDKSFPIFLRDYNKLYETIEKKYWPISPFSTFHDRINKYKNNEQVLPWIINYVGILFKSYQDEHTQKLEWTYIESTDLEWFGELKDNLAKTEKMIIERIKEK